MSYLRVIYIDGKRIEFSTGIFVLNSDWDEKAQILIGRSEKIKTLNNRLDKFVTNINDVYNQLESRGEAFDIISIKEKLTDVQPHINLLQVFEKVISLIESKLNKGYAPGTLKHYRTTVSRLKEYIFIPYKVTDIAIEKVDYEFLNSFDSFLKRTHNISSNTA